MKSTLQFLRCSSFRILNSESESQRRTIFSSALFQQTSTLKLQLSCIKRKLYLPELLCCRKNSSIGHQHKSKVLHQPACASNDLIIRSYSADVDPEKNIKKDYNKKIQFFSWRTVGLIFVTSGALAFSARELKKSKDAKRKEIKSYGKAAIGGPWKLTDHNGKETRSTDFVGKWILIYFGFTNCPDVCPEELEKIVKFVDRVDDDPTLPSIKPLMISVDPERDTAEQLKSYLAEFSPKLLGFTGTLDEVYRATRAYRVYYSPGPRDEDNDYIVDHSIISYLINPKGEFVEYFGQNKKSHEMFNESKKHIEKYNKDNGIVQDSGNIFQKICQQIKETYDEYMAIKEEGPAKDYGKGKG